MKGQFYAFVSSITGKQGTAQTRRQLKAVNKSSRATSKIPKQSEVQIPEMKLEGETGEGDRNGGSQTTKSEGSTRRVEIIGQKKVEKTGGHR